jgi:hypothetical protein
MTTQKRPLEVGDHVRDLVRHREGVIVYSDQELEIVGVRWSDTRISLPIRAVDVVRVRS